MPKLRTTVDGPAPLMVLLAQTTLIDALRGGAAIAPLEAHMNTNTYSVQF